MNDYYWYKAHHICVDCHSEEATPHSIRCPECLAKRRERDKIAKREKRKSAAYREWQKKYNRERREKLKKAGLCCRCGKRKARPGKLSCLECSVKENKSNKKMMKKSLPFWLRAELGICYKCDKPVVDGYKLCPEHLALARRFMARAVDARLGR